VAGALTRIALIAVIGFLLAVPATGAAASHGRTPSAAVTPASHAGAPGLSATALATVPVKVTHHHRLRIIGIGIVIALLVASLLVWVYTRENRGGHNDAE
jgi:hypothetical protein